MGSILVIGSGAREHAIAWRLKKEGKDVFLSPGNGGTSLNWINKILSKDEIESFCKVAGVDLIVVGPEKPLTEGIADFLRSKGFWVFGPGREGAKLEGSKVFAKSFMKRNNLPTADFVIYEDEGSLIKHFDNCKYPVVIKADGLAAGKGVIVAHEKEEALEAIGFLKNNFPEASKYIIVEECLVGKELSLFVLINDKGHVVLDNARDYKRLNDFDEGPNTGGMGSYSPVDDLPEFQINKIQNNIVEPTIRALRKENISYQGVLYFGIMLTKEGPSILEFNCRFGDPEAQVLVPRILNFSELLYVVAKNEKIPEPKISSKKALSVVLTAKGYPNNPETGKRINIDERIFEDEDVVIFYAGVVRDKNNLFTSSGRVLNVVGMGDTFEEARNKAYSSIKYINFEGMHFRRDIGL
ncbi:phosphoribosylamine--glycine ligase [Thermodesulfobium acidiphilum]|uniref:Phosphoribosylamine--glycine ligase n=1 Tax=Thermodesulfobium acidiphilum TaxID=1794699 RepID=A0A2R4VZR3_THEAF|nr:phosphoribosylamine--glycine ligase [Thermodesulfobium acidiphilum]AWB09966.1 phosphoribosylamine--glycine ligase [Thermodesulfobium acidiphilum]